MFSAWSVALIWKVFVPVRKAGVALGTVQGANTSPRSTCLHSKVTPASFDENSNVASVELVTRAGVAVMRDGRRGGVDREGVAATGEALPAESFVRTLEHVRAVGERGRRTVRGARRSALHAANAGGFGATVSSAHSKVLPPTGCEGVIVKVGGAGLRLVSVGPLMEGGGSVDRPGPGRDRRIRVAGRVRRAHQERVRPVRERSVDLRRSARVLRPAVELALEGRADFVREVEDGGARVDRPVGLPGRRSSSAARPGRR